MYHTGFSGCHKGTTHNMTLTIAGRLHVTGMGTLGTSSQLFCKSKTILRLKVYLKKKPDITNGKNLTSASQPPTKQILFLTPQPPAGFTYVQE